MNSSTTTEIKIQCPVCKKYVTGLLTDANGNSMCGDCYARYGKVRRNDRPEPYYEPYPYNPYVPYPYTDWRWNYKTETINIPAIPEAILIK